MANIIKPKRSNTAAKVPTTTELISGELGVNMADRKVYINNGTAVVQVGAGNLSGLGDVAIATPANGQALTYNSTTGKWENTTSAGSGTVTSVGITPGTGVTVSNSPITTSGNIAVGLSTKLTAIENLSGAGFITQNGSGAIAGRTLQAGTGISIQHGNGSSQDPVITNSAPDQTVALTGAGATTISGTYPNFTITSVNTTYSVATSTVPGLVELASDTAQTVAANAVTATASRSYGLQLNAAGQGVVNVPWTDTVYSLPAATATVRGGIELGSNTAQTVASNAVTATASRSYALQVNADGQGVVNVPWTDTNSGGTVTSVGGTGTVSGLTLTGTVTTSGNLTLGGTLAVTPSNFSSQTAKTFLAAPNAAAGVPTFRAIVASDVPTLNQSTTGNAATATTLQTARTINGTSFNGSANITVTANTTSTLTRGTYLTGNNFNGSAATTWAVDATTTNTASKVVARDASGNFSAGTITASLSGNATTSSSTTGNAATATNISNTGTVTLATATESNAITITQPSYTTDTPVKLLNFDWYGNTFSLGNIRSGSTPSSGFGIYYTASGGSRTEIARFGTGGSFNTTGAITQNGSQVLTAGNYNSYAPTKTGGGASGSWAISVTGSSGSTTGNAATATALQTARTINGVSFNGTANITVADSTKLPLTGGALSGVLTINSTSDNQLLLQSTDSWTGIGFNDSAPLAPDYIWHNGTNGTFAIGGGGANVAGKKLHVHGGMTIGAGYAATTNATNGLNVEGAIQQAGNQVLHAGNYNSYAPTKTGGGASGSWAISVTGNAATATALQTARTIGGVSFNGTANINLPGVNTAGNQNTTGNAATATSATTASQVVGTVSGTSSAELVRGNMADNDQFRILVGGTGSNAGYAEIATADDGTEPIYVRQYTGVFSSLVRTATLLDGSGNTSFPGTVTASAFSGNASTATTLQTSRTIRTNLASTSSASFNGSANITPGVTGTLPIANGGTGATTAAAARTALGAGTVTSVGGTGTISGLTLTGTVTSSGSLTLGGNLTIAADMIYNSFTATAAQTTFTTTNTYTSGKIEVFVNGVKMVNGSDVTVTSGTSVVMASGLPVGTRVDLVYPI